MVLGVGIVKCVSRAEHPLENHTGLLETWKTEWHEALLLSVLQDIILEEAILSLVIIMKLLIVGEWISAY